MTCARCLEPTPYPVAHPQQAIWAVRPLGPFAVEGKSHGAATIALTIRLLRHFGAHARTAWAPGLLLEQKDGSKLEVDFAMLRHDAGPWTRPVRVVFGECKTFWKFEQKDVSRMRRVAQEFPGAFLVFASLNNSITEAEARALRRI